MNFAVIEKIVFAYLQAHPEIVEKLVERLVHAFLDRLANQPTAPPTV